MYICMHHHEMAKSKKRKVENEMSKSFSAKAFIKKLQTEK